MLTSSQNPLIKQLRKLNQTKERNRTGLFLVEGTHLVEAACAHGWTIEVLCVTEQWAAAHSELLVRLTAATQRVEYLSPGLLATLAGTVSPGGVVAAVRYRERDWQTLMSAPCRLLILGERLQDPGNVGTLVRTCVAAGADGLVLSPDSVDPDHPKVLRASAGLWFRSPPLRVQDFGSLLSELALGDIQVLATDPRATPTLWEVDLTLPTAFVLGSEGQGLSSAVRALVTRQISIPLATGVESLNVALTAGVLLFEAVRQRRIRI